MSGRVLLVEDDGSIALVITSALEAEGFSVDCVPAIAQRDRLLAAQSYALLITDVMLEDGDGIASLAEVSRQHPAMPVIILSAQNSLDTAVWATETGAYEYFPKPFDLDDLVRAVVQAVGAARNGADEAEGADVAEPSASLPLVGRSAPMQLVFRMITRVLRNDLSVLILGESGTGKELVAEAIHSLGHRKDGPFVAINMAAIPSELIESELFGHEKGAFTGAISRKIGRFEQAQGGTLFLDEIGDMPMMAQTRLLRALQSGEITRVGGRDAIALDVRIVAATNRNFADLIQSGQFREDLYYRINVVPIELPALRERSEDIAPLARHFLKQAEAEGLPRHRFSNEALALLSAQSWRGNVRELRNFIYRLVVLARDELIGLNELGIQLGQHSASPAPTAAGGGQDDALSIAVALDHWIEQRNPPAGALYDLAIAELERPLLRHAMRASRGNQVKAAQYLGINRNTLHKKLIELGMLERGELGNNTLA